MRVRVRLLSIAAALLLAAPFAPAQTYPQRSVRIIVPYAAGGNTDITARAIGGTQDAFARFIREEIDKYAKVIKTAGIKPQ
jgi:tripartite-type tricarboxylate transporter receptor subunit TctC